MLKKLLSIFLLFSSIKSFETNNCFYVGALAGYSSSLCTNIEVGPTWDASPEGYDNRLGHSAVYQTNFGYQHSCIALQLSASYRPGYQYCKFQTSEVSQNVSFVGSEKTRHFYFTNLTFMADMIFNKLGNFYSCNILCDSFNLAPFIGVGIGVAYNNIYDFYTSFAQPETNIDTQFPIRIASIENSYIKQSLAAEAFLGLVLTYCDKLNIEFAYRFFYGGKIQSNCYNYYKKSKCEFNCGGNTETLPFAANTSPWLGKLKANEFIIGIFGTF